MLQLKMLVQSWDMGDQYVLFGLCPLDYKEEVRDGFITVDRLNHKKKRADLNT